MKSIILSAGLGTRALPLTKNIPKPMFKIGGKPVLEHLIILCRKYGIKDIAINLHYHPEKITNYFSNGKKWDVNITYSYEKKLLGTAGALRKLKDYWGKEPFLVLYGDSFTNFNLTKAFDFFRKHRALCTITLFNSPAPWTQGMVITNRLGRVIQFIEKPRREEIISNFVDAGVSIFRPKLLEYIPNDQYFEIGRDLMPLLLERQVPIYALETNGYFQDVGTLERYKKAKMDYDKGISK